MPRDLMQATDRAELERIWRDHLAAELPVKVA
jgi:hypothetical protein